MNQKMTDTASVESRMIISNTLCAKTSVNGTIPNALVLAKLCLKLVTLNLYVQCVNNLPDKLFLMLKRKEFIPKLKVQLKKTFSFL